MDDMLRILTGLPALYIFSLLLLLPVSVISTLGQLLLARVLGFDRKQQHRILWFPLLVSVPMLILACLSEVGVILPEILDYGVFAATDYLYCRYFIPHLDRKQLWIFFIAIIVLTLVAAPVYYLFP